VRLQQAVHTRSVCNGIEMVFGSAAAISAAFGFRDSIGLDVKLLDTMQAGLLKEFAEEERYGTPIPLPACAAAVLYCRPPLHLLLFLEVLQPCHARMI
jgi:hypothetical protein